MDDFEIGSVALARDRPCSSAPKKIQRTSHLKAVQGQRKPAERQWKDSARLKEASAKTAERQCKVKERQRKDSGKAAQGQRKAAERQRKGSARSKKGSVVRRNERAVGVPFGEDFTDVHHNCHPAAIVVRT